MFRRMLTIAALLSMNGAGYSAITFDSSFECGNATGFGEISPNLFEFQIEPDTNSTDRQWFYFAVAGAAGQTLTFRLTGTNTTNVTSHWSTAVPVYSTDGGSTWQRITGGTSNTSTTYTFTHTFTADPERIAFHNPYPYSMVLPRIAEWESKPYITKTALGQSPQGRDLIMLRVSDPLGLPSMDRTGIWIIARQHAAEVTGSYTFEGFMDFLLSEAEDARAVRANCVINVIPFMNPDGAAAGNYRDNSQGINLNRVWDGTATSTSAPEVFLAKAAIADWVNAGNDFSFFADLHSTSGTNPHFGFHPSASISSVDYANNAVAFLALMNSHAPNFNNNAGLSTSNSPGIADDSIRLTYGALSFTFEGAYNYQNYGPNSSSYMTPAIHRLVGEALVKSLVDFYGFEAPPTGVDHWVLY